MTFTSSRRFALLSNRQNHLCIVATTCNYVNHVPDKVDVFALTTGSVNDPSRSLIFKNFPVSQDLCFSTRPLFTSIWNLLLISRIFYSDSYSAFFYILALFLPCCVVPLSSPSLDLVYFGQIRRNVCSFDE